MRCFPLPSYKRSLILCLIFAYYLAVVLPHVSFGRFLNGLFENLDRSQYNSLVAVVFSLSILGLLITGWKKIRNHPDRQRLLGFILLSIVLILCCFAVLFVVYIEAIHFVQYAILAILLFSLFGNFRDTISLSIFFGALDELYQYLVLDTTADYFDFNDVLFDSIGAGVGVLILKTIGVKTPSKSVTPWYSRIGFILLVVVTVVISLLYAFGVFSVNPNLDEPAYFTLFKVAPEGFWTIPKGPNARFHILTPVPGLILIFVTAYCYSTLDRIKPLVETD